MPKSKEIVESDEDLTDKEEVVKKTTRAKKQAPKRKRKNDKESEPEEEEADDDSADNSEEEKPAATKKNGKEKPKEKEKTKEKEKEKEKENVVKDEQGNTMYPLSTMRFISVSTFKKTTLINIREYYEKDGKTLPGKKGISLSVEQWEELKKHIADVDADLKK